MNYMDGVWDIDDPRAQVLNRRIIAVLSLDLLEISRLLDAAERQYAHDPNHPRNKYNNMTATMITTSTMITTAISILIQKGKLILKESS